MSGFVIEAESNAYYERVMQLIRAIERGTDPSGKNVKSGLSAMAYQTMVYAALITHRDTSTLYRSYVVTDPSEGTSGTWVRVGIDPGVVNPRGQYPAIYGPEEFKRGGSHDAFGRAYKQANPAYVISGIEVILNGIKE